MQKNIKDIISDNSTKLSQMIEEKKPYNELLKQSQLLDEYITKYYNENKKQIIF